MEFDGFMEYKITVKANETAKVEDMRLEIPLNGEIAKYWLGMGHTGSFIPDKIPGNGISGPTRKVSG